MPNKYARTFKKFISGTLGMVFFIVNGVFVHASETSFWASRRMAGERLRGEGESSASLLGEKVLAQAPTAGPLDFGRSAPLREEETISLKGPFSLGPKVGDWLGHRILPYGTVNDVYLSPKKGAPFIVHIQDAHGIEEAQRNIASLIGVLGKEPGINLVGVEGATGSFSLESYRDFPDPVMTKDLAEFLLKEGLIAGPEFAGLTLPSAPAFFGVENRDLYSANVEALKSAFKNKEAALAWVDALKSQTEKLKETHYSETLKTFDRNFTGYQSEKIPLGDYVRYLVLSLGHISPRPETPQINRLMEALTQEKGLNFNRVEAERKQLVEQLVEKLSKAQIQDLVNKSVDCRAGRLTYAGYHAQLKQTCRTHGISMKAFPQMARYVEYVLTADGIDRRGLLNELDSIERTIPERLAMTAEEKELVAITDQLALVHKLVRNEMSPSDWAHYQARGESMHTLPQRLAALGGNPPSDFALRPFEDFCRYAEKRNAALAGNVAQRMSETNTHASILIAGGFHTEGLSALLRQRQISYVVVTPKISVVPSENDYLDLLARDPVPLEKRFTGDRIYLAKPLALTEGTSYAAQIAVGAVEAAKGKDKSLGNGLYSTPNQPPKKARVFLTLKLASLYVYFVKTKDFFAPVKKMRGNWAVATVSGKALGWLRSWKNAVRDVRSAEFAVFGAPIIEIMGLPGAAWAAGGSGMWIGIVSFLFALLHYRRSPPNLDRGVRGSPGWDLVVRTLVACVINSTALSLGGDSILLVMANGVILHSGYNALAHLLPAGRLPALNLAATLVANIAKIQQEAKEHYQYFLNKLSDLTRNDVDQESSFFFSDFETWSYDRPPRVPLGLSNLIVLIHGELMRTFPAYEGLVRKEAPGRLTGKAQNILAFWNANRQLMLAPTRGNQSSREQMATQLIGTHIKNKNTPLLEIQDVVGIGTYGAAYRAVAEDGRAYLVKTTAHPERFNTLAMELLYIGFLLHEGNILKRITEKNITATDGPSLVAPRFFGFALTEKTSIAYISEYIQGKTIFDEVNAPAAHVSIPFKVAMDLVDQVAALHRAGFVHRDIKSNNIILGSNGKPRLVDFGAALQYKGPHDIDLPEEHIVSDLAYLNQTGVPTSFSIPLTKPGFDFFQLWSLFDKSLPFFRDLSPQLKEIPANPIDRRKRTELLEIYPFLKRSAALWETLQVRFFRDIILNNSSASEKAEATLGWLQQAESEIEALRIDEIAQLIPRPTTDKSPSSPPLTLGGTYGAGKAFTKRLFGREWSDRAIENWFAMFYEAFRIVSPSRFSSAHLSVNRIDKALRDVGIGAMVLAGLGVFYFGFGWGLPWLLSEAQFDFAPAFLIGAAGAFLLGFSATIPVHGLLNNVSNAANSVFSKFNFHFQIPRLTEGGGDDSQRRLRARAISDSYQNGDLKTVLKTLAPTEDVDAIENQLDRIAQEAVYQKLNKVEFHFIPEAKGKYMEVYECSLLPGIILKIPKEVDPSGMPIDFEKDILPGFQVAKNNLGGLFALMVLENLPINIEGKERAPRYAILQSRIQPLSQIKKDLRKRGAAHEAENRQRELDKVNETLASLDGDLNAYFVEMWRRGIMDKDYFNVENNYGLAPSGQIMGLDVDGIMRIEDHLRQEPTTPSIRSRERRERILGAWEEGKKAGVAPSRVHDIFEADVRAAQEKWLTRFLENTPASPAQRDQTETAFDGNTRRTRNEGRRREDRKSPESFDDAPWSADILRLTEGTDRLLTPDRLNRNLSLAAYTNGIRSVLYVGAGFDLNHVLTTFLDATHVVMMGKGYGGFSADTVRHAMNNPTPRFEVDQYYLSEYKKMSLEGGFVGTIVVEKPSTQTYFLAQELLALGVDPETVMDMESPNAISFELPGIFGRSPRRVSVEFRNNVFSPGQPVRVNAGDSEFDGVYAKAIHDLSFYLKGIFADIAPRLSPKTKMVLNHGASDPSPRVPGFDVQRIHLEEHDIAYGNSFAVYDLTAPHEPDGTGPGGATRSGAYDDAVRESLIDSIPVGSRLGGLLRRSGTGGEAYWASADFKSALAQEGRAEIDLAIRLLQGPHALGNAIEVFGRQQTAPATDGAARSLVRETVALMGYHTLPQNVKSTALKLIGGMLKANIPVLVPSDDPEILENLHRDLNLSPDQKALLQAQWVSRGVSMADVSKTYGIQKIPLSSRVFAQEGDLVVHDTEFKLLTFESISKSIQEAINSLIAVLQAA